MVNQSKVNDPRFWKLWRDSGAVGDKYETDRREAIHRYRQQQHILGNLTQSETKELEIFQFRQGPESIHNQVRSYYLQLKSQRPELAVQMLEDTQPILDNGIHSLQNVEELCHTLHKYWYGFLIRYNGESYTVHGNEFDKASNL